MASKKKSTDHVVVNYKVQPAIQVCLHCGQQSPMPFNQPLSYAGDVMKAFVKQHRHCKPSKPEQGTTVCPHGTPTDERCLFCSGAV